MMPSNPPALLYHKVDFNWEVGVTWVTPTLFRRQIEQLHRHGWRTSLSGDGESTATAHKRVIIAFDDGYESVYTEALPVLERLGFKAMVFIPTGYLGRRNDWDHQLLGRKHKHLTRAQLVELDRLGWLIGSHGISHTDLTRLDRVRLREELIRSKGLLSDILGKEVDWVSFPFGRYNRRTVEMALECGYRAALVPGASRIQTTPKFQVVSATPVYLWDSPTTLMRLVRKAELSGRGRRIYGFINVLNRGTGIWRTIFPSASSDRFLD